MSDEPFGDDNDGQNAERAASLTCPIIVVFGCPHCEESGFVHRSWCIALEHDHECVECWEAMDRVLPADPWTEAS